MDRPLCRIYRLWVFFLVFNFLIPVGISQEISSNPTIETAVDDLVQQLHSQLEPLLEQQTIQKYTRVAIINIKHQPSGHRWELSNLLETRLAETVATSTNLVVVHPKKVESLLGPYWKELQQNQHYRIELEIAKTLNAPLLLLGEFTSQQEAFEVKLQLVDSQSDALYGVATTRLATAYLPKSVQTVFPFYELQAKLELAKKFIEQNEFLWAETTLKPIASYATDLNIEARGLWLWLRAKQGYLVQKALIEFKLFQPGHFLIPQIEAELKKMPPPPSGMVALPATQFSMGNAAGKAGELPPHEVLVPGFYLDQFEVTNQAYEVCVKAQDCTPAHFSQDDRFNDPLQPVVGVTWFQAQQYCFWKNKRLPTEAEWERATIDDRFDSLEVYAWYQKNSGPSPHRVGTRLPNDYGLYDLLGNVLEWVHDFYAPDYYTKSPFQAPTGPSEGDFRVARGGAWTHTELEVCPTCRFYWSPTLAFNFIGFRCAASMN